MSKKQISPIGTIESDFPEKFGIPRQSGIAKTISRIRFLPEFRNPDAFRALDSFSYIWLIWGFSENENRIWHPTVRPPRLVGRAARPSGRTVWDFPASAFFVSTQNLQAARFSSWKGRI